MSSNKVKHVIKDLQQAIQNKASVENIKTLIKDIEFDHPFKASFDWWSNYFDVFLELFNWNDDSLSYSAQHWINIGIWLEKHDSSTTAEQRIQQLINGLFPHFEKDSTLFLRFIDTISFEHEEIEKSKALFFPYYKNWLNNLNDNSKISSYIILCAKILYLLPHDNWETVKQTLFRYLDHKNDLVRAYAARVIGQFYLSTLELAPSFLETAEIIQQKDIERPGIAGPFISAHYVDGSIYNELDIRNWVIKILKERKGEEPNVLPCSNNIDFYAHEILDDLEGIKLLISMGQLETAYYASLHSENMDFKKLLEEELQKTTSESVKKKIGYCIANYQKN